MPHKKKSKTDSIGDIITKIREEKKVSYENLANQTGLSVSRLEKIEKGELTPSVGTLLQLSKALQANFDGSPDRTKTPNYDYIELYPFAKNTKLKAFRVQVDSEKEHMEEIQYRHQGEEFVYVLSGTVEVNVGDHINRLSKGDSLHFNSGVKHGLKNVGETKADLIVVIYDA
ncbi:MAG: helix-turn-helix transcriptional regulator [Deltaproteobacteria bacterium]|nr:helix-turn-helix transcriptional regulator [Deltaproteobacteria bacterium]